jgi:hypothetical protein
MERTEFNKMLLRIQLLEERVAYLESKGVQSQSQYDIDEVRNNIIITDNHLSQILQSSMEEQIILIIVELNKKTPFMKMTKELCMYKGGWVRMDDSDLKLFIETIEHKILLLHSKRVRDAETHFENNKIIYGLNLLGRFKKIKNKLIDNI